MALAAVGRARYPEWVSAYRAAKNPPADEDVAAFAELGRRVSATKTRALVPIVLGTVGAAFGAAILHMSGYLPLLGRMADGSYYVNKGSIAIVMALGGGAVLLPGVVLYKLAVRQAIRAWRNVARDRYRLDEESIDALAGMFTPRKRGATDDFPLSSRRG